MLNVYKYYAEPSELPLFKDLSYKLRILNKKEQWGTTISRDDLEPLLHIIKRTSKLSFFYAYEILKGRFKETEDIIKKDPSYAVMYAKHILSKDPEWTSQPGHDNGRWPDAEPYIMKDPFQTFRYARDVIKGRLPEAETYIMKDEDFWSKYKQLFGIE